MRGERVLEYGHLIYHERLTLVTLATSESVTKEGHVIVPETQPRLSLSFTLSYPFAMDIPAAVTQFLAANYPKPRVDPVRTFASFEGATQDCLFMIGMASSLLRMGRG